MAIGSLYYSSIMTNASNAKNLTNWQRNQLKIKNILDDVGIKYKRIAEITEKNPSVVTKWFTLEGEMTKQDDARIKYFFSQYLADRFL